MAGEADEPGSPPSAARTAGHDAGALRGDGELHMDGRGDARGERLPPGGEPGAGSGVRTSIHSRTSAGTVVNAFGSTRIREAVTRKSGSSPASSSAATMSRAAAASASARSSRRVVPGSARPVRVSASRSREASAATPPAGALSRARSRVWSMWSSTNPRSRASHSARAAGRRGRRRRRAWRPRARRRRRRSARASAARAGPTSAREPKVGVLKRAPSSSAKASTATPGTLGHGEPGRDAERPVEPPARPHAVEVRPRRPPRPVARGDRLAMTRRDRAPPASPPRAPARRTTSRPRPAPPSTPGGARRRARRRPPRAPRGGRAARPPRSPRHPPRLVGSATPHELAARDDHGHGVAAEPVRQVLRRTVEHDDVPALASA